MSLGALFFPVNIGCQFYFLLMFLIVFLQHKFSHLKFRITLVYHMGNYVFDKKKILVICTQKCKLFMILVVILSIILNYNLMTWYLLMRLFDMPSLHKQQNTLKLHKKKSLNYSVLK
jgi:hypothetical protein